MSVCKPLMSDVVAPKVHQNNHSYVSSADLPSDSLCKHSMVGGYTENLKTIKLSKLGGGCLPGTIWYTLLNIYTFSIHM